VTEAVSTPLTEALKAAIRSYYKGVCQYCGSEGASHVEHIIPISKGGPDILGNTTLGCERCNYRKGATELDPMFVAIAHARAREAAEKILTLVRVATWSRPTIRVDRSQATAFKESRPTEGLGFPKIYCVWNILSINDLIRVLPKRVKKVREIRWEKRKAKFYLTAAAGIEPVDVPSGITAITVLRYIDYKLSTSLEHGLELGGDFSQWAADHNQMVDGTRIRAVIESLCAQIYAFDDRHQYQGSVLRGFEFNKSNNSAWVGIDPQLYEIRTGTTPPVEDRLTALFVEAATAFYP